MVPVIISTKLFPPLFKYMVPLGHLYGYLGKSICWRITIIKPGKNSFLFCLYHGFAADRFLASFISFFDNLGWNKTLFLAPLSDAVFEMLFIVPWIPMSLWRLKKTALRKPHPFQNLSLKVLMNRDEGTAQLSESTHAARRSASSVL